MTLNVACAVSGCTNPIIGQCTGYKGSCGRYYCATHSSGTLCADCANRKAEEERLQQVYEDYLRTAEKLRKDVSSFTERGGVGLLSLVAFALPIGLGVGINNLLLLSHTRFDPVIIVCPMTIVVFILPYGILFYYYYRVLPKRAKARAAEMDKTKPGFLQFYSTWLSNKHKEELVLGLKIGGAIAGAVIAGTIAAAADSAARSREEERVRNAVDDELRRRGY